jgi:transcriptional regulator with XRE-family HTH domain
MSTEVIGANIRLARLFNGLSLTELGERLDRSKQYLSRVETGDEPVSGALEHALLEQLGVLPEFLRQADPMPLTEEQCHFRKQLTTKAVLRQHARARGDMLKRLVCVLEEHLELPGFGDLARLGQRGIQRLLELALHGGGVLALAGGGHHDVEQVLGDLDARAGRQRDHALQRRRLGLGRAGQGGHSQHEGSEWT